MARCLRRRARLGSWFPRRAKPLSSTCRLMVIGTLLTRARCGGGSVRLRMSERCYEPRGATQTSRESG